MLQLYLCNWLILITLMVNNVIFVELCLHYYTYHINIIKIFLSLLLLLLITAIINSITLSSLLLLLYSLWCYTSIFFIYAINYTCIIRFVLLNLYGCCYYTGYTLPTHEQQTYCSCYSLQIDKKWWRKVPMSPFYRINCLFLKTHQPFGEGFTLEENYLKATLLLRHPYDAAFTSYKR